MKISKKQITLENGLQREWLITNGLGGYASSTILNCNTRKYHGLLIAPITPPARRHLILSKVDEAIQIGTKRYNLFTNMCDNYISEGYKYLDGFEKEYIPTFSYDVEGIKIQKSICMVYGENTVCILYKIKNTKKNAKLMLAPVLNFRDFHRMSTNHEFGIKQEIKDKKVKVIIDDYIDMPIYMNVNDGNYIEHYGDTFRNMFYLEEEKRGFFPSENHVVSGRYEINLLPNEEKEITFVCSLEENIDEINAKDVIEKEIDRLNELVLDSELQKENMTVKEKELIRDYIIASDNFVVYRPSFILHTLIAGYPWFLDWGRDALIAFEGLVLIPKRFTIAKEVLLTFTKNVKYGLLPNGYSGFDNRPLYNSADASLLLFEQVEKYVKYTNDVKFVKEKLFKTMKGIIEAYKTGIDLDDNNIYLDKDHLLVSGTPTTQNTWMDAKYGDFAITPRNGKAVEINALWYNALKVMEKLSKLFEETNEEYATLAKKCKISFIKKFYNSKKKCLFDVIGDGKVRPNQLFSIALSNPVVDPNSEIAKEMFETVNKKLLTKYGLKTLAKGEENYIDVYEGDSFKRDMSYHQGPTWPWLLGLYYDAFNNIVSSEKNATKKKELKKQLEEFKETTRKTLLKAFYEDAAVGSISEIYDSKAPYMPRATIAQGWSVSEFFKIYFS